jgi:hypothetical protein
MNVFKIPLDTCWPTAYSGFEHVQNASLEEPVTESTIIVVAYLVYLLISVNLTIWVARTLHKRGAIFLVDAFQGNTELAASINHLLVVGFYLINIGFVSLALRSNAYIATPRAAIEMLADKLGWVLLILGGMHFFNLLVFSRIRSRAQDHRAWRPPVAPDAMLQVTPPPPMVAR